MIIITIKMKKKCRSKLEWLLFKMLLYRKKRPKLNPQSDCIRAKLFVWTVSSYYFIIHILVIHTHTHTFSVIYSDIYVNFSTFDNDDMKSSILLSIILFLKNVYIYIYIYIHTYIHTYIYKFKFSWMDFKRALNSNSLEEQRWNSLSAGQTLGNIHSFNSTDLFHMAKGGHTRQAV